MPKSYKQHIAGAIVSVSLSFFLGCSPDLKINPSTDIPSDKSITNASDLENALASAYAALRSMHCVGGSFKVWPDIASDLVVANPASSYQIAELNIYNRNFEAAANDTAVAKNWEFSYKAINRANEVIAAAEGGDLGNGANIKRMRGEAYVIRGLVYFELARWYAPAYSTANEALPAIPMPLKPARDKKASEIVTVGALYKQIESDLTTAAGLLPARYGLLNDPANIESKVKGNFTGDAAKAILSKVYFFQNRDDDCLRLINQVIGAPTDSIAPSSGTDIFLHDGARILFETGVSGHGYPENYPLFRADGSNRRISDLFGRSGRDLLFTFTNAQTNTSYYEVIAQIMNNPSVNTSDVIATRFSFRSGSLWQRPRYLPSNEFYNLDADVAGVSRPYKTSGDVRYVAYNRNANFSFKGVDRWAHNKYATLNPGDGINIPIIRSAELLLNRAEVLLNLGGTVNNRRAAVDLSIIKRRSNSLRSTISPFSAFKYEYANRLDSMAKANFKDELLAELRKERIRELFLEGDRLHYLRKLGQATISASEDKPSTVHPLDKPLLPIPSSERIIKY